ncbi:von Willebrand factor A domain-related protein, putative [Plasmodium gallinaceum]|uniref:von Willebrand factor A domain-related protein, putative n=1 Tax=Plasmodium gallinaceum TaxID=5849 RepID=A0A1J1GKX9_PLAGA|nr:von Willebrand factor A domain-related protein, putative [Plasmodium gallinaceum]CRG93072.1 von Willebrand factor A domain-related protein, putative [Plasmodium gallinaceum]
MISYLMLLLSFFAISTYEKLNVISHSSVSRLNDEKRNEKVITCVVEYIIRGDMEIDDNLFCENETSCSPSSSEASGSGDYCDNYYDITLIVEESNFVQKDYWIKGTIPFLESMIRNVRVSKDKAHMSIILFDRDQRLLVPFTDEISQDKQKLIEKVKGINDVARGPDTLYVYALEYALENVIFGDGTRSDAPKVAVLFYYGYDYGANKSLIPDIVEDYKENNIKLIIVGIGLGNKDNAYLLADCSIDDNNCANVIFKPWDFVIPAAEQVKERICNKNKSKGKSSMIQKVVYK